MDLPERPPVEGEHGRPSGPAPHRDPEVWIRDETVVGSRGRSAGRGPVKTKTSSSRPRAALAPDVSQEIARHLKGRAATAVEGRLAEAASAFERDRLAEAVRLLRPLVLDHPGIAAIRELAGLALYRSGKWSEAARNLEAQRSLTGLPDQIPVIADCYRALKRYRLADRLWEELKAASPPPPILAEGRIVTAGSLADRGRLDAAVALLERAVVSKRRGRGGPPEWEVRTWYALADHYERSGDAARARDLFSRVVSAEPGLADAAERLSALS